MTNDKTVTMSRELAQFALNAVEYLALRADDIGYSNEPVAAALRAALAAPVVERQELDGPISELEILRATCKQLEEFRDKTIQSWMTTRPACFAMKSMIERIQSKKGQTHSVYGFPEDGYDLPLYTSPPAPVAADELQAIQDRHEAWMAGVEQGKAESELGAIKESEEFEKWRNAQIDVLIRNGYPEGAEAFRNLGSVQWAGWQARACLDKIKELNQ